MMPNKHHPGPRCSCSECQPSSADVPASVSNEVHIRNGRRQVAVLWPKRNLHWVQRTQLRAWIRYLKSVRS